MRVRILAIGTRMPEWVSSAYQDYTRRLQASMRVDLEELPHAKDKARAKADEQERLLDRVGDDYLVALDEHGKSLTTLELAKWLSLRQQAQVGDLRAHVERCRRVGTHRHASAAADTRGGIHCAVGIFLRDQNRVAILRAAGRDGDKSAHRDQAVE